MEAHVAGSRSGSRKSRHPAACHQAVVLKHLVRLQVPTATRQRPLAGLWMGVYGPHGPEIISLGYDGRGSGSMIVATKITGDPNVPAGEVTFRVDPEPLSQPWPLGEVELITNRPMYTTNQAVAMAAALAVAAAQAALAPEQRRPAPGVLALPVWATPWVAEENDRLEAVAAEAAAADPIDLWDYLGPMGPPPLQEQTPLPPPPPAQIHQEQQGQPGLRRQPTRVVAVYRGQGRVAGPNFRNPEWIEGRLWVYDNGSVGFLWSGMYNFLVDLNRINPQLLGRAGVLGG
ncbi:hypothetical protein Vafri_3176 [Volvox africanus]|uniref:Uncharacterized protein n=1 Tax=Volvox africanus TaxID=51714 RepID=A0A8J4ETE9_9CHLO|nr:hypothetical protein Vafri_3176 [Volvox africanus]